MKMTNIWFIVVGFAFVGVVMANGPSVIPTIKGRLLSPQEGCGYSKVLTKRIVGGAPAKNGAYPWMALLRFNRTVLDSNDYIIGYELSFDCGGSLITSKHVLTAAHCIDEELILVRLGEYDTSITTDGEHQDVSIDHVVKHEKYDDFKMINDLAIIHLAHDVDFTDRIRPVCLPIDGDIVQRDFVESNPFVAGYGRTSESTLVAKTSVLMQLQVPVVEVKQCEKEYLLARADSKREKRRCERNAEIVFDEHVFCAGYNGDSKGTFFGDSGGPLMLPVFENGTFPYYQIGVVSGADSCIRSGFYGIFQKIQYYADWIHENLKIKNSTD